ncbi:MAG: phospholipid carrier-dependent glycosyltransferase [Terriglobia bacterium]|jgi:hypothetical protein
MATLTAATVRSRSLEAAGWSRYRYLFLAAGYLLSLGSRLPALLFAPRGFFYNTDELTMGLRSLDSFIGVPVVSLAWPGSILNLLSLPVFLGDFLPPSHLPRTLPQGISLFADYLAHAYADPRHSILLVRWIVAITCSVSPILAYYIGVRLSKSRFVGFACAVLVSFQPTFYQESVMAAGDAVSITFALAAILCLLRETDRRSAAWAGFLMSAGLAAKITVAGLIVLPVLLILLERPLAFRERAGLLLRFSGGLAVGFMLCCPYVWTEPVRFAKAVAGNLSKPGSAGNLAAFFSTWSEAMGITFSALALFAVLGGICLLLFHEETRLVIASFAALIATLAPPFLHATTAYPRYFLPALPCLVVLLAVAFRIFNWDYPRVRRWRVPALALAALAGFACCGETWARERSLRGPDEFASAVKVIQTLPRETTLFLPEEALLTFEVPLSQQDCLPMRDRARHGLESEDDVLEFAQARGIPSRSASVILWSLNEQEQADYRRLAAACTVAPPDSRSIYFYYAPYDARNDPRNVNARRVSLATLDLAAAIQAIQNTGNAAILVPFAVASLGKPLWSGARWRWYRR